MSKVIGTVTLEWLLEQADHGFVQIFRNNGHIVIYTWLHGYLRLEGDQLVSHITFGEGPCEGSRVISEHEDGPTTDSQDC